MKATKRRFKGRHDLDTDKILDQHDLSGDFDHQDLHIEVLLQKTNNKFCKAGTISSLENVQWNTGFDPNKKDQLYVIAIQDRIVKYGMTETGLKKRHQSLLTGKPKYSKANKNSETNRRSYSLLEKAIQREYNIVYYAANIENPEIIYESIDGEICIDNVAPTREEERKLAKLILESTKGVQPLLNVQIPGGIKNEI